MWHERQLLIDGELVDAADGALFPTINPATEEVLGTAADAGGDGATAAVAAARRAFDTTDWAHCLRQLHETLTFRIEEVRSITVAEAGAPVLLTRGGPQLEAPVEMVRCYYGPDAPFGGCKQSGIGREMGVAGFEEFLEIKTLAEPAP